MSFLSKLFGPSWTLINIGVCLFIAAFASMVYGPAFLANRHETHLQMSASITANMAASIVSNDGWNVLADSSSGSDSIDKVLDSVRNVHNLTYLVISDEDGRVLQGINEAGARRLKYNLVKSSQNEFSKTGMVSASMNIALSDSSRGMLYLGLSDPEFIQLQRTFRRQSIGVGIILLLLSAGLFYSLRTVTSMEARVFSLRKAQKDLFLQKGTLQSKMDEHQKTTAELKESEQRYRYLLENAMTSAFSDLEALNKDLERQKGELEIEIEHKTIAQASLATYADRLASLNAIERLLVSEVSLNVIVNKALQQIQKLINCNHVAILQVDKDTDRVEVLGSYGEVEIKAPLYEMYDLSSIREKGESWLYNPDLRAKENRSQLEEALVYNGLFSYGQATLTIGDALVGALIVSGKREDAFNSSDITAVRDIADLISLGLSQQQHRSERDRYELELITERDRAEEMARLKTAFLANMSHEIRTPLSGIIGFAQVLHEEVETEQQEFTGLIQDAAKRLMNTINSVLDLAKLEALKASPLTEPIDLSEVVDESLILLKPLASKKGIEFNFQLTRGIECHVDRGAVQSIVNNVVGNAIKFTESGSVRVSTISSKTEACIKVQDTGVGISKEFIPYLFDEFRQEHMGSDRPHEGSGLGLAIANKLVIRLGGRIEVESELNEGTTFSVFIPLERQGITDSAESDQAPNKNAIKPDREGVPSRGATGSAKPTSPTTATAPTSNASS